METNPSELAQPGQATVCASIRERISTWLTFAVLLLFFIITIAFWGYAAWWGGVKLIGLFV